ncbi:hypothetical protein D8674_032224 [Pyrus ussuriensis x Pyrus communis]|uniref:Uncharacterized protein n=1 Tax=Pyrus ussuriensis x Pyrus communis TaxID=2448454 RepID=A0A5N5FE93_9ROSA|nr:hypothetical protein D8674_032224 [Pyrus ussuriensis x Pyrus communis]
MAPWNADLSRDWMTVGDRLSQPVGTLPTLITVQSPVTGGVCALTMTTKLPRLLPHVG